MAWIALGLAALLSGWFYWRWRRQQQLKLINQYPLPSQLRKALHKRYPHLQEAQLQLAQDGLRQFWRLCHQAGQRQVAMPSQAVDVLWHEYILHTRSYQQFCQRAFGRFLHHTPAEAMHSQRQAQEGIRRAWRLACADEKLSRNNPTRLPLLFALDALLVIPDGFSYQLNCQPGTQDYCASHIGCSSCASGCGGDSSCSGGGCGGD